MVSHVFVAFTVLGICLFATKNIYTSIITGFTLFFTISSPVSFNKSLVVNTRYAVNDMCGLAKGKSLGSSKFNRSHFLIIISLASLLVVTAGCMKQVKVEYIPPRSTKPSSVAGSPAPRVAISELSIEKQSLQSQVCKESVPLSTDNRLHKYLSSWKGVKYRRGGTSQRGIDCSALTQLTYKTIYGVDLPRTVRGQSRKGIRVEKSSLLPGDLVFFKTGLRSRHVGIYIGDNQFIHASRSKGVISSSLNNSYWRRKFWQAKHFPQKIRRQQEKILFKG